MIELCDVYHVSELMLFGREGVVAQHAVACPLFQDTHLAHEPLQSHQVQGAVDLRDAVNLLEQCWLEVVVVAMAERVMRGMYFAERRVGRTATVRAACAPVGCKRRMHACPRQAAVDEADCLMHEVERAQYIKLLNIRLGLCKWRDPWAAARHVVPIPIPCFGVVRRSRTRHVPRLHVLRMIAIEIIARCRREGEVAHPGHKVAIVAGRCGTGAREGCRDLCSHLADRVLTHRKLRPHVCAWGSKDHKMLVMWALQLVPQQAVLSPSWRSWVKDWDLVPKLLDGAATCNLWDVYEADAVSE